MGPGRAFGCAAYHPTRFCRPLNRRAASCAARAITERRFAPLLADDFVAEPVVSIPAAGASRHDLRAARGPAAIQRESEDIQIHIGRIEVTAVHPPATRTPKAPDRGPSLDAYLNRRAR